MNEYYMVSHVWAILAILLGIVFTVFNKQVSDFNSRMCEKMYARFRFSFLKGAAKRMKDLLNRFVGLAVGVAFIVIGLKILIG